MPRTPFLIQHVWKNRVGIGVRVFKRSRNSEPSDVIELRIAPANGKPAVFHLNVVDALAIVHCLGGAASMAIEQGSPIQPED